MNIELVHGISPSSMYRTDEGYHLQFSLNGHVFKAFYDGDLMIDPTDDTLDEMVTSLEDLYNECWHKLKSTFN
jgi:hypothetical protein